jgi:hypothetical protein
MKPAKISVAISALVLGLCLQPKFGWTTIAYNAPITGTVTAAPSNGTIEIDHRSYHIKPDSAAAKQIISIYVGESVDVIVDGPAGGTGDVIVIMPHQGS